MPIIVVLALFLAIGGRAATSSAGVYSVDNLVADCRADNQLSIGRCKGFVEGVLNLSYILGEAGVIHRICLPETFTIEQAIELFLGWVEKNPNNQHLPAVAGVQAPLRAAFSCKVQPQVPPKW